MNLANKLAKQISEDFDLGESKEGEIYEAIREELQPIYDLADNIENNYCETTDDDLCNAINRAAEIKKIIAGH